MCFHVVGEGFCAGAKSLAKPDGSRFDTPEHCFDAAHSEPLCTNKMLIAWGKGSRAGLCKCDTVSYQCFPRPDSVAFGADGYDRLLLNTCSPTTAPLSPGETARPSTSPTAATAAPSRENDAVCFIDVGEGVCGAGWHELTGPAAATVEQCMLAARNEPLCEHKDIISWGKGWHQNRCVCDRVRDCQPHTESISFKDNGGFDRLMRTPCAGQTNAKCYKAATGSGRYGLCEKNKELLTFDGKDIVSPGDCLMAAAADHEASGSAAHADDVFAEGPKVPNVLFSSSHCGSFTGTLEQAKQWCRDDALCTTLHDYNGDNANWRACADTMEPSATAANDAPTYVLTRGHEPIARCKNTGVIRYGRHSHANECYCDTVDECGWNLVQGSGGAFVKYDEVDCSEPGAQQAFHWAAARDDGAGAATYVMPIVAGVLSLCGAGAAAALFARRRRAAAGADAERQPDVSVSDLDELNDNSDLRSPAKSPLSPRGSPRVSAFAGSPLQDSLLPEDVDV